MIDRQKEWVGVKLLEDLWQLKQACKSADRFLSDVKLSVEIAF